MEYAFCVDADLGVADPGDVDDLCAGGVGASRSNASSGIVDCYSEARVYADRCSDDSGPRYVVGSATVYDVRRWGRDDDAAHRPGVWDAC